ncbi:MAG: hypothetical protein HY782_07765 [Chloroflexi bacterium]|nr:hypothetical protein [Chloroflexota bacterium]
MNRIAHIFLIASTAALLSSLYPSGAVSAHPLGNFTVNRYAELLVQPRAISLEYIVDMAEIPTFQEIKVIDKNRNGGTDETETAAYRAAQCGDIPGKLLLSWNGNRLVPALTSSALEFPPGAGDLPTLRLTCRYQAALDAAPSNAIVFRDSNLTERIGWREIVVKGDGAEIRDASAPSSSISDKLRSYPNDLINNPPNQTEARFTFVAAPSALMSNAPPLDGAALSRTKDAFAALVTVSDLTWQVVLLSLLLAVGLGAVHAVSPGHGKTIMAAYLVGAGGTVGQAFVLGLTVTITHTLGVLALGLVTLFASRYIFPEGLYPLLSLTSGVLAMAMGIALAHDRVQILRHDHDRKHAAHAHSDGEEESVLHGHSHHPARLEHEGLSWRSLVGLGLAGGIVPSTSALILLLSAISLQRIPFGLVLITAFGLGMALVLVGIGVMLVRASQFLERRRTSVRVMRFMPLISAVVVIGAGIVVTTGALAQMWVWKLW